MLIKTNRTGIIQMESNDFVDIGIEKAIQHNIENGIEIGATVAHKSCKLSLKLIRTDNEFAYCELPTDPLPLMFPVNEIFDLKVARQFALEANIQFAAKEIANSVIEMVEIENIQN